jgi:hypothetical protein
MDLQALNTGDQFVWRTNVYTVTDDWKDYGDTVVSHW